MKLGAVASLVLIITMGLGLAQVVEFSFDDSADFAKYKTYQWMEADGIPLAVAKPKVPVETVDEWIRTTIEETLEAKGFTRKESGPTDLLISYFGIGRARIKFDDLPSGQIPSKGAARVVTQGTLTLDMVDAEKNQLVWRGEARVETIRGPEDGEPKVKEAATKILEDFPPQ